MPQDIAALLERLRYCELGLQASRGYIKALEYGLHAVISSHPDPAALAELWSHVLPEVADARTGGDEALPVFDAAFQEALAGLSEHITGGQAEGG